MKKIRIALWVLVAAAFTGFVIMNLPAKQTGDETPTIMPIAGFNKGAHFALTTHEGQPFDSTKDISEGEYGLIFFGFTHCPVICPTELQKFATIIDSLPADIAGKIHPTFITIDPERDTVEVLKDYVPLFHPKILGLTGDVEKVHAILNDWKVYFTKVDDPQFTEYTMDHSTYSYLVDADMNILGIYRMQNTEQQIVENIKTIVKAE